MDSRIDQVILIGEILAVLAIAPIYKLIELIESYYITGTYVSGTAITYIHSLDFWSIPLITLGEILLLLFVVLFDNKERNAK